MLLMAFYCFAQQRNITGIVTNKSDNTPIVGATVQVNGKTTITDNAGKFSIEAAPGDNLRITNVGMKPVNIKISSSSENIMVPMETSATDLEAVVVTGYKSERKVDLTGAVAVVKLDNIKNVPTSSPMLALQGQVPGLYVQTDGSPTGANGGQPTILIRGATTLNNTNPLYIIDGVPTTRYEDFANLSPGAIASMQVLKDASAASIYGSRASNGVIIVTTKNGGNLERVNIQLNSSLTTQSERPWRQSVLSSQQRGTALWQAAVNDSTNPNGLVSNIYTYDWNGDYSNPVLNKVNIAPFVGGDSTEPVANTNWQNALFKPATVTSNDLSISAGSGKSGFLFNVGYYNNNGLIQFTKYQRYNARINSHTSAFNNRLKIGENLQVSRTSQINSTNDVGGASTPSLAITLTPTIPLYKTDGTYGGPIGSGYTDRNNPVDMQYLNRFNTNNQFLTVGNIFLDLEIIKNLVYHTSLGFEYSDGLYKNAALIGTEGPIRGNNSLSLTETKEFTFTWANTLNYNLDFGQNRVNILAGTEAVRDDFSQFGAATANYALQTQDYLQLSSGVGAQTNFGGATGYRLLSQFGKLFYGYSDRYLASFTIRRDGSSKFGTNNPYGVFPAVTLGWRINNENFFKNVANSASISNFKVRAGRGTVGNQISLGNLAAYTLYAPNYGTASAAYPQWLNIGTAYDLNGLNTGTLPSGFSQIQKGNPNLKWEQATETNVGLDFGFLNEKITGSFDWYDRNTSGILTVPKVPAALGEGQTQFINGPTVNSKGWELITGYHDRTKSGLGYSITVNADHFTNVITKISDDAATAYPGDALHSIVGHSQFSIFGYKTEGLFQTSAEAQAAPTQPGVLDGAFHGAGRIKYADLAGVDATGKLTGPDGKIDANDQTWLGTTLPKVEYGMRLSFDYKNFDLTIFGSGVAGKTSFDPVKFFNDFANVRTNFGPGALDAWSPQNKGSKIPALSVLNHNAEDRNSDYYFVKANYFKLRNVMLGYNLPKNIASSMKMEGLRIYVSGQNLFVFKSKDFTPKDPERTSIDLWPVPTAVTFGLNANF